MVPDARGAWFQTGIYSAYFYTDDQHDILGQRLYTRVSSYCDWLSNLTNNDVQCYQPKPPSPPPPPPKNICGNRGSNFTSMLSNNIYGGCFAKQGEFPWEGLMEIYSSTTGATLQYCGVTLLSSNYALTTASCLTLSRSAGYSHIIRFGMVNRTDSSVIVNTIARGYINSRYITNGILHNVGIIRLTVSMNFNDNIQPICIPNDDSSLITQANTVAGWGAWSLDSRYCGNESTSINRTTSEILVKTTVPVINNILCQLYYPSFNTSLTSDTLCAGTDANGASNVSDWATPLMVANANGVWFQTGVMSAYFYTPQKTILAQRVYARVSSYCAWFNTTTNGEVQCVAVNGTLDTETTTPATSTISIVGSATASSTATVNTTTENKPAPSKSNRIFSFTTLLAIEFLIIIPFIF
uniref:Peptidase S1 domain-containing protein n=1 Tax=Acrobeloides nanus TaxID=290746 RepID=A0A914E5Q3_9BILA